MKLTLAQIRLKTGDFEFNFNRIVSAVEKSQGDLIILPQVGFASLGGKDLCFDTACQNSQNDLYGKVAKRFPQKNILLGDVLICGGKISKYENGMFEGLEILAQNRYFTMNSMNHSTIQPSDHSTKFIYVNAVAQVDENIYAGGSFVQNAAGEIIYQAPLCKEDIIDIDFSDNISLAQQERAEVRGQSQEQQVIDVVTFALREYCENTGFKQVILGLSGGIDSALSAVLAVKALGAENVFGVLMPSMYSSKGSVDDALKLAQNLGIKTEKHPITPLFDNFMDTIVNDKRGDLAEENLQARLRMLILMFFSNRGGKLLLANSNKSESAVGYGTLYGDMAGGFNMIADLTKTNVYKIANYINKDSEIIPHETIEKPPSAELRPDQKDQDSLPDYEILDDIIEMHIEQQKPLEEVYAIYDKTLVDDIIKRICRAEFKRRQATLGVRLTDRSFCYGVNLPIVQKYY